jgi:hypothetical protein
MKALAAPVHLGARTVAEIERPPTVTQTHAHGATAFLSFDVPHRVAALAKQAVDDIGEAFGAATKKPLCFLHDRLALERPVFDGFLVRAARLGAAAANEGDDERRQKRRRMAEISLTDPAASF